MIWYNLNRKKSLSFNDKKLLKSIGEKEEYKNNYYVLCSIDILLDNSFDFKMHYKNMKKKDKEVFDDLPIHNLLKK